MLWGKVVALWFAFLAHKPRKLGRLMHVMRDRSHVIKEFRVHGPASIFVPDLFANDLGSTFLDRVRQGKPFVVEHTVTQTFVGRPIFVHGRGRRTEPAFVDPASIQSVGVEIIWMKL
jgi:hypothetical protein